MSVKSENNEKVKRKSRTKFEIYYTPYTPSVKTKHSVTIHASDLKEAVRQFKKRNLGTINKVIRFDTTDVTDELSNIEA